MMKEKKAEPATRTCTRCRQLLPIGEFERFPGGTHRYVCRRCKYVYYSRPAKIKWILRTMEGG
ncbi:MAG: hypothetical protein IJP46_00210 [Prevotella sp.]|nr:hypothetical protein [Prevotella sp.]